MGALGHYLESEGLATASISLIRLHSEKIRPPRALWVPFELGRPLGVPDDVAFQARVLRTLINLLDAPSGPVLEDYPEDVPHAGASDMTGMACPIRFERAAQKDETLAGAVRREIGQLQPWFDLGRERRGRTTFGAAGLEIGAVVDVLSAWADQRPSGTATADRTPLADLKLAVEDLKAYYLESAAAQPSGMTSRDFAEWFWGETEGAKLLAAVQRACVASSDPAVRTTGTNYIIPRAQWPRMGIDPSSWGKG